MENNKELKNINDLEAHYKQIFQKIQDKLRAELSITDSNILEVMMNRGKSHEFFISLFVDEKRKCKDRENQFELLLKKLTKFYLSPNAKIQASTQTEAKEMAMRDERYIIAKKELSWRQQIVEYLEKMNKLLDKQYFTISNIIEFYKLDKSNVVSPRTEESD